MLYPLNEYMNLFTYEQGQYGDDPDDDNVYTVPVVFRMEVYDEDAETWYTASPYPFRKREEIEDYISCYPKDDKRKKRVTKSYLGAGFPETVNWEESKKDGVWRTDDWE